MTSTDPTRRDGGSPTVAEITALTTRLRDLSARARTVDPAGRAAFLADKQALLERITDAGTDDRLPGRAREEAKDALSDVALARAAELPAQPRGVGHHPHPPVTFHQPPDVEHLRAARRPVPDGVDPAQREDPPTAALTRLRDTQRHPTPGQPGALVVVVDPFDLGQHSGASGHGQCLPRIGQRPAHQRLGHQFHHRFPNGTPARPASLSSWPLLVM